LKRDPYPELAAADLTWGTAPPADARKATGPKVSVETVTEQEFVIVGKLGRKRGVSGEMFVVPETDFPERFLDMTQIHVLVQGEWQLMKLASARFVGDRVVVRFEGVTTPEEAARLTNRELAVPRDQVVSLPENRYYVFDLVGCEVCDHNDGSRIGSIAEVELYPANDVYVVLTDDDQRLSIAAVEDFIKEVDIIHRRVLIDRSGLFDAHQC
jgi:16S rRNA processing protein RimM